MTLEIPDYSIEKFRFRPDSSIIGTVDYDGQKQMLKVTFKRGKYKGKTRKYKKVSPEEFNEVLSSESIGKSIIRMSQTHHGENLNSTFFLTRFLNSFL